MLVGIVMLVLMTPGCSHRPAAEVDASAKAEMVDNGMPFGKISEENLDQLFAFARSKGVDLRTELEKAYKKDTESLGRVFQFSTQFETLDQNCRAYGQIIYSSFLNLGEAWGVKPYGQVLSAQTPEIQQRIRDFIFYAVTLLPEEKRKQVEVETKKAYPEIFPADYVFGKGDPLIEKK